MRAARIHRFGDVEELVVEDVATPEPGRGEVLLRVAAAGVNPVDRKMRRGDRTDFLSKDDLPAVLGREVSGRVVARGPGLDGAIAEGDRLFAMLGFDRGAFAEFVIVREPEWARVPSGIDIIDAGAVPLAGFTAWQALFEHGRLPDGGRVLIHGGSGGVGHFAVQFAKARGATVFATASAANLDFLRALGVDHAIDYAAERFEDVASDLDVVLDMIGGDTRERSWSLLKRGGALISTLDQPDQERAAREGVRATRFTAQPRGSDLAEIAALIERGAVRVHVTGRFPLSDIREAERRIEDGGVRGKLLVTID